MTSVCRRANTTAQQIGWNRAASPWAWHSSFEGGSIQDINVISLDLTGRDLFRLTSEQHAILATPKDNLSLATSVEVLVGIIRASDNQPFGVRIPDDPRLLAVWHQVGEAAVVMTYWRHKLAHVDLVIAGDTGLAQTLAEVPLRKAEIEMIRRQPHPLLVRCRVRKCVPAIAEVLGMVAYAPAMLNAMFGAAT